MASNKIYRTVQGDAFDAIAFRLWGDEKLARELVAANPEYADVALFGPGVELVVPQITVKPKRGSLPPWYSEV